MQQAPGVKIPILDPNPDPEPANSWKYDSGSRSWAGIMTPLPPVLMTSYMDAPSEREVPLHQWGMNSAPRLLHFWLTFHPRGEEELTISKAFTACIGWADILEERKMIWFDLTLKKTFYLQSCKISFIQGSREVIKSCGKNLTTGSHYGDDQCCRTHARGRGGRFSLSEHVLKSLKFGAL